MMRSDTNNWHDYGGYTKMTAPSCNIYSRDEDESKHIIVQRTLLQNCSANKDESKQSIVNKKLLQNYSADVGKLCDNEEDKSDYTITEQTDKGNEVTYDVPNFNVSNIFKCRRNNPDVSYERAYMATSGNEYFTEIHDHLNKYNDRQGQIFSRKKFKEAVFRIMEQQEEEIEYNIITLHEIL